MEKSKLRWISGHDKINTWIKDSGFTSSFCKRCGSVAPNLLRDLDYYWIPVGSLEDGNFKIVASIYLDSKASWATVAPESRLFESMPSVTEFINYLDTNQHG